MKSGGARSSMAGRSRSVRARSSSRGSRGRSCIRIASSSSMEGRSRSARARSSSRGNRDRPCVREPGGSTGPGDAGVSAGVTGGFRGRGVGKRAGSAIGVLLEDSLGSRRVHHRTETAVIQPSAAVRPEQFRCARIGRWRGRIGGVHGVTQRRQNAGALVLEDGRSGSRPSWTPGVAPDRAYVPVLRRPRARQDGETGVHARGAGRAGRIPCRGIRGDVRSALG